MAIILYENPIFAVAELDLDGEFVFCAVLFWLAGGGINRPIGTPPPRTRPLVQPLDARDATGDRDFDGRGIDQRSIELGHQAVGTAGLGCWTDDAGLTSDM